MSYTDVHEPLRFDGIHVAVLSGDNGHGKSALLDAITWVLWGQSRARTVDDLIHTGATEMEVELEFILDEIQYRVIRKRQRRGRTAISTLDFFVQTEGSYRSLTERSLLETEKAIQRTLKMSYETFTSSSFIQQGKADTFTTHQPGERKRILAEILELGAFDELEARAREQMRQRELELQNERARSEEYDQEVARIPEYEAAVTRLEGEVRVWEARVSGAETACNAARESVARLEAAGRALAESEARRARFEEERKAAQSARDTAMRRLAEAEAMLARAPEIEAAGAALKQARLDLETADVKLQVVSPLRAELAQVTGALEKHRARLDADVKHLVRRITELRVAAESLARLEADHAVSAIRAAELAKLEEERKALQAVATTCREEVGTKKAINDRLRRDMNDLKVEIDTLEKQATCPSCRRPWSAADKARAMAEMERRGKQLASEFRDHERAWKAAEAASAEQTTRLAELEKALMERDAVQRATSGLEASVRHAREAARQLGQVQTELSELEKLLQTDAFGPEERARIAELRARIEEVQYDAAAHTRLREAVGKLAGADERAQLLDRARQAAEHFTATRDRAAEQIQRLDEEIALEAQRAQGLREEGERLSLEREQLVKVEADLRVVRTERDRVRDARGTAQSGLTYARFAENRVRESVQRQHLLRQEQSVYAELVSAFGKKGLQAMIIETAIPEIEQEANAILGRMTDGRMNVKLETQRDARAGSGTIETLDIKIADELGTRSYEMFSGGEGFRVNFALRIALSKLLARRAGTRLQTLVIDEGFGSQDAEGRDRIVEAIQAISADFEKILVVTHLDDLRDRFPVRIEITKSPRGSLITLR